MWLKGVVAAVAAQGDKEEQGRGGGRCDDGSDCSTFRLLVNRLLSCYSRGSPEHPHMHIPPWIDNPRRSRAERAQLRLKFMLSQAALRKWGHTSIHVLATHAKCNHSSIFNAINRGYFTEQMAQSIEQVFGRAELPHEWLVDPLNAGQVNA